MIDYKPYNERTPDTQYKDLVKKILDEGQKKYPPHGKLVKENEKSGAGQWLQGISAYQFEFDLSNGWPLVTERDCSGMFGGSAGEMIGFINGAESLEEMMSYGCPKIYWEQWTSKERCEPFGLEEGHIGQGSYGPTLRNLQFPDGERFDQVKVVMNQMKNVPFLQTHCLTTWNPPLALGDWDAGRIRKVTVAPCHANFMNFMLYDEPDTLELHVVQRSADVLVGLPNNLSQWCLLGLMTATQLNKKFTRYSHTLLNAHIYDVQMDHAQKIIGEPDRKLGTVTVKEDFKGVENVWDFRKEDFDLNDYESGDRYRIPTPV